MRPHVVRRGEHLAEIAYRNGSDPDAVWKLRHNERLAERRPGGHMLAPGDLVVLPDPTHPAPVSVRVGGETKLVANIPRVPVSVRFRREGRPLSGEPWHIEARGEKATGATSADGLVSFDVRVTTRSVRLCFDRLGESTELVVGGLDPVDRPSGVAQRLRHLGLYHGVTPRTITPELTRAIVAFQTSERLGASGIADAPTQAALVAAHGS